MKLWQLEEELQAVRPFENPKVQLEQYMTTAHLASHLCFVAHHSYDDMEDKSVLDLGCGTGMLAIGSAIVGASRVVGIDIDADALGIAAENCFTVLCEDEHDEQHRHQHVVELMCMNIERLQRMLDLERSRRLNPIEVESEGFHSTTVFPHVHRSFDTVVLNPPFGTRSKGMDIKFLKVAASMARNAVYSMHKSSTRDYILKTATRWGYEPEVVAELRYDLKQSYAFHKKQSKDIAVDVIRLKVPQNMAP